MRIQSAETGQVSSQSWRRTLVIVLSEIKKQRDSLPAGKAGTRCLFLVSRVYICICIYLVINGWNNPYFAASRCWVFHEVTRSTLVVGGCRVSPWRCPSAGREGSQCWALPLLPRAARPVHPVNSLSGGQKQCWCFYHWAALWREILWDVGSSAVQISKVSPWDEQRCGLLHVL